jgi:predicted amidophosphoribosyltransferase
MLRSTRCFRPPASIAVNPPPLPPDAAGALCASCWAQVRFIERPFCERLGTPFAMDLGNEGLLSPEAVADPPVFARARAVAHFEDGPVRQLVHRLKYNDRMELAKPLGAWMARVGNDLLAGTAAALPRPGSTGARHRRPMRRPGRSFRPRAGQADAIPGRTFALATGSQFARRVSGDGRDGGANRRPRRGAYRRCQTSGATANAASRSLLRGGAKRVDVLVSARAV